MMHELVLFKVSSLGKRSCFQYIFGTIFCSWLAFVFTWHIYCRNIMKSYGIKHEMIQWKCFVPNTPSFCDHIWSHVASLNTRWCWCTPMCHWLRGITLSSNEIFLCLLRPMEQKFMCFYLYFIADYRARKNLRCPFNWWWFSADRQRWHF